MSTRAARRRAEREAHRVRVMVEAGEGCCDRCGRHLDDGPPGAMTLSVDLGGSTLLACGHCAPALAAVLGLALPHQHCGGGDER
jgi:hypothetical protein